MADPEAPSSWQHNDNSYDFEPIAPTHIPRAWERAPKSPLTSRLRGHKIWKRYGTLSKAQEGKIAGSEESISILGDATNTQRSMKRMRLKDARSNGGDGKENKPSQYFTTLCTDDSGTPRRKQIRRQDLKPNQEISQSSSTDNRIVTELKETADVIQDDALRASESPALDDVRELLHSAADVEESSPRGEHTSSFDKRDDGDRSTSAQAEDRKPHESGAKLVQGVATEGCNQPALSGKCQEVRESKVSDGVEVGLEPGSPSKGTAGTASDPTIRVNAQCTKSPIHAVMPQILKPGNPTETCISLEATAGPSCCDVDTSLTTAISGTAQTKELDMRTPTSKATSRATSMKSKTPASIRTPKNFCTATDPCGETPGGSPQIGTSLLRRESLRRKESPHKKGSLQAKKTAKKRDTLQRRDTLQEREILQKVIAEAAPHQTTDSLDHCAIEETVAADTAFDVAHISRPSSIHSNSDKEMMNDTIPSIADTTLPSLQDDGNKDLHRAIEAIEAYVNPISEEMDGDAQVVSNDDLATKEAIDHANRTIANIEVNEAVQVTEDAEVQREISKRQTRSAARFSDDTSMLKEFLNRAQAKKAAKRPVLLEPDLPQPQTSPRRSPRKAFGSHDGNASTPQKLRDIANRSGTPPGKPELENPDPDDAVDVNVEPTSCRRSTRTRLPAPSKAPPGAPSFIPVRRADGTDAVVLQKSHSQELAMTTRANTRRNKGQSKPPILALQDLPLEVADTITAAGQQKRQTKSVGWAERLASYSDAKETETLEEARPKVRRMKGLGSVNGTPVAKRVTAIVGTSNGTPAPKRKGKIV